MKLTKCALVIICLTFFSSCRNSKIEECIDSKVEQGWSYKDAKEECESAYADSKIRH